MESVVGGVRVDPEGSDVVRWTVEEAVVVCGVVVWCGVVWCGVVWCGVVWCGVV